MYFSRVNAKANTSGARFVWTTVDATSSSLAEVVGKAKDSSKDAGDISETPEDEALGRFEGDVTWTSPAERFFVTRFALARMLLACFSSGKVD